MNDLRRKLAPITKSAWKAIEAIQETGAQVICVISQPEA